MKGNTTNQPFRLKQILDLNEIEQRATPFFSPAAKMALFSAFLGAILVHFPELATLGKATNGDTVVYGYHRGWWSWDDSLGRWGFGVFQKALTSAYFPIAFQIILGFLFLGMTAFLMVDLLKIRSKVTALFMGLLLASFMPIYEVVVQYYYISAYFFGILLAVFSVFAVKYLPRAGFIAGAFCIMFSIAIYQVNIEFCILLIVLAFASDLIQGKQNWTISFRNALRAAAMGVVGCLLYVISLQKYTLASYRGANDFGHSPLSVYIQALFHSYPKVWKMYFSVSSYAVVRPAYINIRWWYFGLLLTLCIGVLLGCIASGTIRKRANVIFLALILVCSAPILNFIGIILPESDGGGVNCQYHYVLPLIFALAVAEKLQRKELGSWAGLLQIAAVVFSALIVLTSAVQINLRYSDDIRRYNADYATIDHALARAEELDGYTEDMPYFITGNIDSDYFWNGDQAHEISNFAETYMGRTITLCDDETEDAILASVAYQKMQPYPNSSSVQIIEDTVVIRFPEE
jgi:hypothetical protein